MMDDSVDSKSTVKLLAPENEAAEEIDDLVNELNKISSKKARILYIHYTDDEKNTAKIDKAKIPKRTYFRYLTESKQWIKEQLCR